MSHSYSPSFFPKVIDKLPEAFYIQGEFPLFKNAHDVIKTGELLDEGNYNYALLTGPQLEDLIFCLVYRPSRAVVDALLARISTRILGLLWAFFQYHHSNEYILELLTEIQRYHTRYEFKENQGQIIFLAGFLNDTIKTPAEIALSGFESLDSLIKKYDIIAGTPYWRDLLTYFFIKSPPALMIKNFDLLYKLFRDFPIPVSVLLNYLNSLHVEEFSQDVSQTVIEKIGFPGETAFWDTYPVIMSLKITDWHKINRMRLVLNAGSKKYKFLSVYAPYMQDVFYNETTGIFMLLFGSFNIADDLTGDNFFIYCRNHITSLALTNLSALSVSHSAKDFMVEGINDEYMSVFLSGLDLMYAKEMFDILLKISDDYRDMR
ncbi:MAG: hypothetical protein LBS21_14745 [Clostridiales bacterium]|jgi:hypothetical protein|nr:hypothetical protein [Clostridiales bacterium]